MEHKLKLTRWQAKELMSSFQYNPSMLVIQKLDGVDDFLKYERVYGDEFGPG